MLGAGTVINPIIKIVTVVAILAATYFFIVKPVLDTTERTSTPSARASATSCQIQEDVDAALETSNSSGALQNCIERRRPRRRARRAAGQPLRRALAS